MLSSLERPLAYNGGRVEFIDDNDAVYIYGNGLVFFNVNDCRVKDFVPNKHGNLGISAYATNPHENKIAIAPRSTRPCIYVMAYPSMKVEALLEEGTDIEYVCLAFSRDASRLCAIAGPFNYNVYIWSMDNKVPIAAALLKVQASVDFFSCTFNPIKNTMICTSSNHGVVFSKLEMLSDGVHALTMLEVELANASGRARSQISCRDDFGDGDDSVDVDIDDKDTGGSREIYSGNKIVTLNFQVHCWSTQDDIFAVNYVGDLLHVDAETGKILRNLNINENPRRSRCVSIVPLIDFIILAFSDGLFSRVNRIKFDSVEVIAGPENKNMYMSMTLPSVTFCCPSLSTNLLLMGSIDGKLHTLPLTDIDEPLIQTPIIPTLKASYHRGPVVAVASFPDKSSQYGPSFATGGVDGSLRLWRQGGKDSRYHIFTRAGAGKLEKIGNHDVAITTQVPVTSLAVAPDKLAVAVGLASGTLYLVDCSQSAPDSGSATNSEELTTYGSLQLYEDPLTCIKFNPNWHALASASTSAAVVYVVDVTLQSSTDPISVLTCVDVKDTSGVSCLSWHAMHLVVASRSGSVSCFRFPPIDSEGHWDKIPENNYSRTWIVSLLYAPSSLIAPHNGHPEEPLNFLFGISFETNKILRFILPIEHNTKPAHVTLDSPHDKAIVSLCIAQSGRHMATGGADGKVVLWAIYPSEDDWHITMLASTDLHADGVLCVEFSSSGTFLYSTGLDCAFFSMQVAALSEANKGDIEVTIQVPNAPTFPINAVPTSRQTWLQKNLNHIEESAMLGAEALKSVKRKVLTNLRRDLQELLSKNNGAGQLEKMDRKEFVVDVAGQDTIVAANRLRADEAMAKFRIEDELRDGMSLKIRCDCWDSMEVQATECRALQRQKLSVTNCPLKRRDPSHMRAHERVHTLRKLELGDIALVEKIRVASWPDRLWKIPINVSWIVNQGDLSPDKDTGDVKVASGNPKILTVRDSSDAPFEEDDGDAPAGEDGEFDFTPLGSQLYPPVVLKTPTQKRVQMVLLSDLIYQKQVEYNAQFEILRLGKYAEVDKIDEKNMRIREILSELGSTEDYFRPSFSEPDESPEVVTYVKDTEISGAIVDIDPSNECNENSHNTSALNSGDASTRALQDMMFGTLEVKKDTDMFHVEVLPPAWIDSLDLQSMSEEQRKELDEYNSAQRIFEEQRSKYRKALELELKKLRTEVGEISRNFDEKVNDMNERHVFLTDSLIAQELYLLRMGVSLMIYEDGVAEVRKLHLEIGFTETKQVSEMQEIEKVRLLLESATQNLEIVQSEDQQLERNFKRDILTGNSIVDETIESLTSYFHHREVSADLIATKAIEEQSTLRYPGGGQGVGKHMQSRPESNVKHPSFKVLALQQNDDGSINPEEQMLVSSELPNPTNPDNPIWTVVQVLRRKKIDKELELNLLRVEVSKLKKQAEDASSSAKEYEKIITSLRSKFDIVQSQVSFSQRNAEILTRLQQGQDELEQESVVTEYDDALLIPTECVNIINQEIGRLGSEQFKTLNKIKQFRKSINFMEWENMYMEEQSRDLEEYYTDLQLLHVTKNLQSIMKGDQRDSEREQAAKASARVDMMKRMHDENCCKLNRTNSKLLMQVKKRQDENERLKQQLSEFGDAVLVRETIFRSRLGNSKGAFDSARRAAGKMKRITLRRRLIDLARLQTEEIDFLRQELDRLRHRTFPSFAHVAKARENHDIE